jgi:hypothetical protein
MRKRNGLFIVIFLGSILLFIYFIGNLSESKKNVDIAKIEYERSKVEVKKAQLELDRFLYEQGLLDKKIYDRSKAEVDKGQLELDRLLSEHGFLSKPKI